MPQTDTPGSVFISPANCCLFLGQLPSPEAHENMVLNAALHQRRIMCLVAEASPCSAVRSVYSVLLAVAVMGLSTGRQSPCRDETIMLLTNITRHLVSGPQGRNWQNHGVHRLEPAVRWSPERERGGGGGFHTGPFLT